MDYTHSYHRTPYNRTINMKAIKEQMIIAESYKIDFVPQRKYAASDGDCSKIRYAKIIAYAS